MTISDTRPLRSAAVIAKALGCSPRTVQRLVRKGSLKVRKLNGPTSPLIASRAEIERLRTEQECD